VIESEQSDQQAIRRWWRKMGSKLYRDAKQLLITHFNKIVSLL
jgi:hypothetical protein